MTMAPAYLIRELQPDDLDYIAANLRSADARELRAASGHSNYRDRLTMSVAQSSEVRVVEHDGRPILVFGFAQLNATTAGVWAVGTPTVSRFRAPLVRETRKVIRRWFAENSELQYLVNLTHAGNRLYLRWLKAIGATVLPKKPLGPRGELFRPFVIERNAPCANLGS